MTKYEGANGNTAAEEREKFGSIEEASSFWRELWEGEGTGNSQAEWLNEVRDAIFSKVPPPTEEAWTLETTEAVGILKRKKNWSAPGPDKLVNYWWKRAQVLHEGMARSFEAISRSDDDYPSWFAEGKTSLIPGKWRETPRWFYGSLVPPEGTRRKRSTCGGDGV